MLITKATGLKIKDVSLVGNEFVPLGVPKFGKSEAEGLKHSKFKIEVFIEQGCYNKLVIYNDIGYSATGCDATDYAATGQSAFITEVTGTFSAGQTVLIDWDGFINDIYDSRWFTDKDNGFALKVSGIDAFGVTHQHSYIIKTAFKDEKWLDITIDRGNSRIDVLMRVNIDLDMAVKGSAPDAATVAEIEASRFYIKARPILKKQVLANTDLLNLATSAMQKYWSRNQTTHKLIQPDITIQGQSYQVFTQAVITDNNALPRAKITFNSNRKWGRSNSFPGMRNIIYNVGYTKYRGVWSYERQADAESHFQETFAHEMGHSIVWDYRGWLHSLNHEGSSTIWQRCNYSYNYPALGELDLNKYSGTKRPVDFFERVVANAEDIKGLLWISRLKEC